MGSSKDKPVLRYQAVATEKERTFAIEQSVRIGRHPYNEVSVGDNTMSRYHCWVSRYERDVIIEDLGSSNGTFVNGSAIAKPTLLQPGDRVKIGKSEFEFGLAG